MRACPACHEQGIYEHSVRSSAEEIRAAGRLVAYSCCTCCGATFERDGEDEFSARPAGGGGSLWCMPPWREPTDAAAFEFSWDFIDSFFEGMSARAPFVRSLRDLVPVLRAQGYGSRLRAGQSLNALGLSRARESGLRPEQSHVFVCPYPDGSIKLEGHIGGAAIAIGPRPAAWDDDLRDLLEQLARIPID